MEQTEGGAKQRRLSPVEGALVVVVAPLACASWLALLSAQLGRLSPAISLAGGCVLLLSIVVLAGKKRTSVFGPTRNVRLLTIEWVTLAIVIAAVWRLAPAATPWPTYLDASWYVNAGAMIAADGRLESVPDVMPQDESARRSIVSTLADGRAEGFNFPDDPERGFHTVAFTTSDPTTARVSPYHPPLFSSWIAVWSRLFGQESSGSAVLPWTLAYLLAAGALASAALGSTAAGLAVALVAAGPAIAYYGATPYAETAAGALALTGLWLLVRIAESPRSPALGAAAGLFLGLACITKVDAALALAAAAIWWLVARRRRGGPTEAAAILVGLAVPLVHGALLAASATNVYVALNGWGVLQLIRGKLPHEGGMTALVVLLLAVGMAAVVWWLLPRGRLGSHSRTARRLVALVVVVAMAALTVLQFVAPEEATPGMWAILGWMITPLGLWAAVAGLVLVLEDFRPRHGPLIAVALLVVPLVLAAPVITTSLSPLYTARRLVPLVLPIVAALAGLAAARALSSGQSERASAAEADATGSASDRYESWALPVAGAAGAVLVLLGVVQAASGWHSAREFSGGAALAGRLATYGRTQDVMLFPSTLGADDAGRMAAPVWLLHDRPTAVLASPSVDPSDLAAAIEEWRMQGREVYYVASSGTDRTSIGAAASIVGAPIVPGFTFSEVGQEALITYVPAPVPALPPAWAPKELSFVVYRLGPLVDR